MDRQRYERIQAVFLEAIELEGGERVTFLERACAGDDDLLREVEQLLKHDEDGGDGFDQRVFERMHEGLSEAVGIEREDSETARPSLMPGKIGPYRILEKIGEGGMGTVYLAEQEHPRRPVALKVIRPDLMSPSLYKRFQFEAEVLGMLQHPGIAQILEAGKVETERGSLPFFAMEYIAGVKLGLYAKQHDLGIRARLEVVARICDAVHHAHLKGIVHRDLKPGNVLVVEVSSHTGMDGASPFARLGQPKVLDFGVARATDGDVQLTTMGTDVGKLVGTITYMSPEQVAGDSRLLDSRSDIYAIGVILYELLAGHPPFDLRTKSIPEAARIIREEEPTRLGSIRSVFRGDVDTIVNKAIEKDRERRYASAAELAADIRRYLANEPIFAHPPSALYQLKKFARRNKGLVIGIAMSFLILIAGTITALSFAFQAMQNEQRALTSEEGMRRAMHRLNMKTANTIGESDPPGASILLEAVPEEFRGWEWRHLNARFTSRFTQHLNRPNSNHWLRNYKKSGATSTACYSDGTPIASLVRGDDIELIDLSSGEARGVFGDYEGLILPVLSFNGSHLAAISRTKQKLIVWNTETRDRLLEVPLVLAEISNICFNPDGSLLLISWCEEGAVLMETATGLCRLNTTPYPAYAEHAVFSLDGSRFALCGRNWGDHMVLKGPYFLCIYTTSGECLAYRLIGLVGEGCEVMAFSPDGAHLAIGQTQNMIRILDAATLEEEKVLFGHTASVTALAFSRDGHYLASASKDGTTRIWDHDRGTATRVLATEISGLCLSSLNFAFDEAWLVGANTLGAGLWALRSGASLVLEGHSSYLYRVTFSPDGMLIASGGWDKTVRLWDALTGEPLAALPATDARYRLSFTPDGRSLIGSEVWDTATGCQVTLPRATADKALPESKTQNAQQGSFYFDFAASGAKYAGSAGERTALSWDRSLLAVGQDSGEICIMDRVTGKILRQVGMHDCLVLAVAFNLDTNRLVSGDEKGIVKVWDLDSGEELAVLEGHTGKVYSVNYSPDGSRIVSGGSDCNIILWDAGTFEQSGMLQDHTNYVHSVCFNPDGTRIASASGDGTVRLWDSVPPDQRWRQIQRNKDLRRESEPLVVRLLEELGDPLSVADHLRADKTLGSDLRSAALRVLLKRSASKREGKMR